MTRRGAAILTAFFAPARLPALVLILCLTLPVLAGIVLVILPAFGYQPGLAASGFSLDPWRRLLAVPGLERMVLLSLAAGLASAALALLAVLSFLVFAGGTRIEAPMRRLVSPLLAMPHAAAAFGLAFLIGPSGWLARLLSPWATGWHEPPDLLIVNDPHGLALIAGLTIKEIPFLLLVSLAALPQIATTRRLGIARSLGYGPRAAWMKAVLPGLYPLIRLPVLAVISYASASVDMALILGPTNPPTLSVALVRWFNDPDLSRRGMAAAAAVLQLGVTLAALGLWRLGEILCARLLRHHLGNGVREDPARALLLPGAIGVGLSTAVLTLGALGLGLASVAGIWRFPDVLPQSWSLAGWMRDGAGIATTLGTTALVATLTAGLCLVLTIAALASETRGQASETPLSPGLVYLPLIVPQVVFMPGLVVLLEAGGLRPGLAPVVLAHGVFVLPYLHLALADPFRRLDPRFAMAARGLGASPLRTLIAVRLPLLLGPLLAALAIAIAVSVGQYLPTLMAGAGRVATVTTEAVALSSGGDRRLIGIWALAQMLLPLLAFALALAIPRWTWRNRRDMRSLA
jgi:putative thiamine transport system permease protein